MKFKDPASQRLGELRARAESLEKKLGRWADLFSGLVFELDDFARQFDGGLRPRQRPEPSLPVTRAVSIMRQPSGALVQIDQGSWIELSPSLTELLVILCADNGSSVDELVSWKPLEGVVRTLGKDPSTRADRHAIVVRTNRLRRVLAQHGVDPGVVQTSRQHGLRFALVRSIKGAETSKTRSKAVGNGADASFARNGLPPSSEPTDPIL